MKAPFPSQPSSILITGLPQRARNVAAELSPLSSSLHFQLIALSRHPLARKLQIMPMLQGLRRSQLFYQIGGALGRGRLVALARRLNIPAVVHWVGSDLLDARRYLTHSRSLIHSLEGANHWAVAPWLVEELAQIGIESRLMPLPCSSLRRYLAQPPPPLPDHLTVLSYLPDEKPELYRRDWLLQLAQDLPAVHFFIVGGSGVGLASVPPNLRFLGHIKDLGLIYGQTSLLVRVVAHDGAPRMVQEALALGRQVIWSYSAPGICQARSYAELQSEMGRFCEAHRSDQLALNWEGRAYVQAHHDPDRVTQRILDELAEILKQRR
jgi:hypothetical protein